MAPSIQSWLARADGCAWLTVPEPAPEPGSDPAQRLGTGPGRRAAISVQRQGAATASSGRSLEGIETVVALSQPPLIQSSSDQSHGARGSIQWIGARADVFGILHSSGLSSESLPHSWRSRASYVSRTSGSCRLRSTPQRTHRETTSLRRPNRGASWDGRRRQRSTARAATRLR